MLEDRPQLDLFVDLLEFVDALLQTLDDGQLERMDHSPAIGLRDGFSANQQVVNFPIDKVVEPGRSPEEALEFGHAHDLAGRPLARLHRGDHGAMLPRVGLSPIDARQILSIFFSRFSPVKKVNPRHGAVLYPLTILADRMEFKRWHPPPFTLFRNNFDDWIVRGNIGQEFGHFPPGRKLSSPP